MFPLDQLSARLLGWRRSWDPPAILLELPAGNNQSHSYSRSYSHSTFGLKGPQLLSTAQREDQGENGRIYYQSEAVLGDKGVLRKKESSDCYWREQFGVKC